VDVALLGQGDTERPLQVQLVKLLAQDLLDVVLEALLLAADLRAAQRKLALTDLRSKVTS
jgi:hypothetical protein